jgi:glycine/D-amino acid oxidase-like deaminating enzyme
MPVAVDRVPSDEALPTRTSVVVIGGGIIGVSTALFLARRGVAVTLCEKGEIAAEQSSRNWGWCRRMGRDPREVPLVTESLRLWAELSEREGLDTGFRRCGTAYLGATRAEMEGYEAWLASVREYQVDSRLITPAEVERLMPGATRPLLGALYTPGDGGAEPAHAAPALAQAARRAGATILTNCAVRGLERQGGRVSAVVTERGRIGCDSVVLAGGAWSRLFCGSLGIDLPQLPVLASVFRTAPISGGPDISAVGPGFGYRKRRDGGYTIAPADDVVFDILPDSFRLFFDFLPKLRSEWRHLHPHIGPAFFEGLRTPRRWALDAPSPFERVRILDPVPTGNLLARAREGLAATWPVFREIKEVARWGGMIDATPDAVPVIGEPVGWPGFVIATGFSGHGFGIGPGAGRLVADLVTGDRPVVDAAPFRLERFR